MLKRALLTWTESRIIFVGCLAFKAAYFLNSVLYFLVREGERMTNVKVTCACGAIYEVKTKGPSRLPGTIYMRLMPERIVRMGER
jgi:hypothetical protein